MEEYKKISLSRVKDIELYLYRKLKKEKKVLIIAGIERISGFISAIYSFACTKDENTWYRCYWRKEDGALDKYVLTQTLYPVYMYEKNGSFSYTGIYDDSQNITSFKDAAESVQSLSEKKDATESVSSFEDDFFGKLSKNFFNEVYISKEEADIGNFGSQLELDFIDNYMNHKKLSKHDINHIENMKDTIIHFGKE